MIEIVHYVFMGLSKVFDCLNYELMNDMLDDYGLEIDALFLMHRHFKGRIRK